RQTLRRRVLSCNRRPHDTDRRLLPRRRPFGLRRPTAGLLMTASLKTKAPDMMSGAYRAVWRWHFYAGVLVMPFLMLLTLTGGLYLFKDEIDHALYRSMIEVPASARQADPDQWLAAAARAGEGRAANVLVPDRADQAVRVRVDRPDG